MNPIIESFKVFAESAAQTYENGCIYFLTDLDKYIYVKNYNFDLKVVVEGRALVKGGFTAQCISENRPIVSTIERKVFGERIRGFAWPIVENDQVIGAYGVIVSKLHAVELAFPDIAEPMVEAFPEGAFLTISDLDHIIYRQSSKKFDIPNVQIGTLLKDGGVSLECIKAKRSLVKDIDANVYGVAARGISIPLVDPEDNKIGGTFSLFLPRKLAEDLQSLAVKLRNNSQEIAAVMQEIAASAGEISMNESHLTEQIKEVTQISREISTTLDFIKSVADQTKMLGLNAAIEAARAGEHGRGFGVVAEEIRKLSDHSKETSDRIRQLLKKTDIKIHDVSETSMHTLKQSQEQAAATEEVTASVMEMSEWAERLSETAKSL